MSVATNDILKSLSDLSASADKIVEENASEYKLPRLKEWLSIVKNKADSIVSSGSITESEEIPNLVSYLRGTSQKGPRVSTVLSEIQRLHLHRGKGSIKVRKSRLSSVKTPLRRKSNAKVSMHSEKNVTPKLKIPPTIIKKTGIVFGQNVNASTFSSRKEETLPVLSGKKGTTSPVMDRNSKRKSSSELLVEKIKKPKINVDQLNDHPKEEKQMKAKNSSLLPNYANIKSSVTSANVSVLKENRTLRSKLETKQDKAVENRKNIMALRQQKLEANKKKREEKMEKTLELRVRLEKEKHSKLRSGAREKNPTTTPKTVEKGEKQASIKKMELNLKKLGTSGVMKGNEKTPVKKNQKQETEKMMNTTYITGSEQPSTGTKGKTLKEVNIDSNSGAIKDKSRTHTEVKSTKTELQKKKLNTSPSTSKGLESYAITPARSSFVSYDISEIRSDSEDDVPETNSKPIPSWATGVRLRNALLQQHHHPIDTDELFGNVVELPDLAVIMGVKKKHYNKRTSSAVWNSSFSFS